MQTASRYELLDRIAIGGMAELFRARIVGEQGFTKVVAIKRILPQYAGDEHFVRMLIDEARTASHLSHPNIAEVHELRRDASGGLFIALEYVPGPSLAGLVSKLAAAGRRLPEACALDVAIHLLEALDHAHRMTDPAGRPLGVVHRDVSPDNVLVTREGTVKLTDFGVAKARGRMTKTQQGTIKGKLAYMSPEQVRGAAVDGRADQFAAALVLWEALCCRPYYEAPTDLELMKAVADAVPRKLADAGLAVAPEVEAAMAKALSALPEERFASCSDFAHALATYHRRTWPEYRQTELGAIVDEFYKERFELLAERLRRFEQGTEKPVGTIDLATDPSMSLLSTPDEAAATDTKHRAAAAAGAAKAAPRRSTKDQVKAASTTRKPTPKAEDGGKPRTKTPPAQPAPKPDARKEQDAEIDQALAAAKKQDRQEKKTSRKGVSGILAFLGFVVAVGLGIVAMSWLRGTDLRSMFTEEEAAPLPQPATPLARPDDGKAPKPPATGTGTPKPPPKDPAVATPKTGPLPKDGTVAKQPPKDPKDPGKKPDEPSARPADGTGTGTAAPVAAPPAGKGVIDLECEPEGCEAALDGGPPMPTPLTREVASGVHKVRFVHRMLNMSKELTVEVAVGKTAHKKFNLVTGQ